MVTMRSMQFLNSHGREESPKSSLATLSAPVCGPNYGEVLLINSFACREVSMCEYSLNKHARTRARNAEDLHGLRGRRWQDVPNARRSARAEVARCGCSDRIF